MERDSISNFFWKLAFRIHPKLAEIYERHMNFFNDGFVELICLVIANTSIGLLSLQFVGLPLMLLAFCFVTPITFTIKYLMHKFWVWRK